jgi:hypothetical protein
VVHCIVSSRVPLRLCIILNPFSAQDKTIKTPPLVGTILPGVTRKSVLQLATDMGFHISEEDIPITEAMHADEVFTTGALCGCWQILCWCVPSCVAGNVSLSLVSTLQHPW